ncbi:hypothetical protein [Sphingobium abikonense]|uniref:hypothetical protein n=1 Tax=Sphingobium abikonense TaxID=86193 RepID=UPI0035164BC1
MTQHSTLARRPIRDEETAIDRTQILDCKQLWPDPLQCPDWPLEWNGPNSSRRYEGERGRRGAESRLEQLGQFLNRGGGNLRAPGDDDRAVEFARIFKAEGDSYHRYGIADLSPLGRNMEGQASLIVEAAHVRGYLRKLDAQEQAQAIADEKRKIAEAQARVDGFARMTADAAEELDALAEAAARHRQRMDDEKAFDRCNAIRQNVRLAHSDASRAAHMLGVTPPALPAL